MSQKARRHGLTDGALRRDAHLAEVPGQRSPRLRKLAPAYSWAPGESGASAGASVQVAAMVARHF